MKFCSLITVLAFCLKSPVFACSELGKVDFKLSEAKQNECAKLAKNYALDFVKSMVKNEKSQKGYAGPNGSFKTSHPLPVLYTAQNRVGNSKLLGFNVGIDFKNKWDCSFCVNMKLDENENCRIESIEKFMCAN